MLMKRRFIAVTAILALIVFAFQNCGRSGFQTTDEESLLTSSGITPGSKVTTPVAFDVGLDAIAFNSCVPSSSSRSHPGIFSLKVSAGGVRGGARLTSEFLSSAQSQLRPILGNPQVLDVQYKQLIEDTNPEADVQVALRPAADYQRAFIGTAPNGVWGRMDYLSHDSWLTPLVDSARRNNNAWVPYSARAPSSKSRFDFSFSQDFTGTDYWSGLQSLLNFKICLTQGCSGLGRFNIAVGFSEPGDRNLIRGPASSNSSQSSAYGRGYALQFGFPDNRPEAGSRVVRGITEYNLQNQNPIVENGAATSWSCLEIPIMSPNQRGISTNPQTSALDFRRDTNNDRVINGLDQAPAHLCRPMPGSYVSQYYNQLRIGKLRELLPSHQWQLGVQDVAGGSRLCAIPIGFDCYPSEAFQNYNPTTGQANPYPYYISYFPGERCINEENLTTELSQVGANATDRVCGHYISVCFKQ